MTVTWKILDTKSQITTGLIQRVTYQITAQDGERVCKKIAKIELQGSATAPGFIPFQNVPEEILIQWVKETIGTPLVTVLEMQLQSKVGRNVEKNGLPWQ